MPGRQTTVADGGPKGKTTPIRSTTYQHYWEKTSLKDVVLRAPQLEHTDLDPSVMQTAVVQQLTTGSSQLVSSEVLGSGLGSLEERSEENRKGSRGELKMEWSVT